MLLQCTSSQKPAENVPVHLRLSILQETVTTATATHGAPSSPLYTSPSEQLISPDHRRKLLEQATKQFRRRRAFSVLNFDESSSPAASEQQSSAWKAVPFPLMSPNHREKLLQRATDTLKRHRRSSLLHEEGATNGAPPNLIDLWRDDEKGVITGHRARSRTVVDCVENSNASPRSPHEP